MLEDGSDASDSSTEGKEWNRLTNAVTKGLRGNNIPTLNLTAALFKKHSEKELSVHEIVDPHLNETAHTIAAREIFAFLYREKLISPR